MMERDEKREYLISLRESTGMTRKEFAIEYNIPYPTITDWELGHRRVPEYFLRLLEYKIGIENMKKDADMLSKIVIITGASHTGKTNLAQRLLEKYHYPYVSQDHIKMGLIRSGNTSLTPNDDDKMTEYLWPITKEMIKTAIENKQNLIVEGCYVPFDWKKDFSEEYLKNINYICICFSDEYIDAHFDNIKSNACCIENRLDDSGCTKESLLRDNRFYVEGCKKYGLPYVLVREDYLKEIADDKEYHSKIYGNLNGV